MLSDLGLSSKAIKVCYSVYACVLSCVGWGIDSKDLPNLMKVFPNNAFSALLFYPIAFFWGGGGGGGV